MTTAILERLLSSNARWAADVRAAEPTFFEEGAKGQAPKVLWIGCADSRVPEAVVTASRPGDIFVHRNVANQYNPEDPNLGAVVYYAVHHLGVQHVIIVGHTACGGVAAANAACCEDRELADPTAPGADKAPLNVWLAPLIKLVGEQEPGASLHSLVTANVRAQVANAVGSGPITSAWEKGLDVSIHGWLYDLERGQLHDLGCSVGPPASKQ